MSRKITVLLLMSLIILGFLVLLLNLNREARRGYTPIRPTVTPTQIQLEKARVIKVIDGDTIEIENQVRVRYIGIDTPELGTGKKPKECFSAEATLENKKLVAGKIIEMEKDVSNTDKYGRLLRYVYVDSQMVNRVLIANGFAKIETIAPDIKFAEEFNTAQKQAQIQNLGRWKSCNN